VARVFKVLAQQIQAAQELLVKVTLVVTPHLVYLGMVVLVVEHLPLEQPMVQVAQALPHQLAALP
jgi:hypothetical protein